MYKDRNQLLFFLFLFPNLQENYLSNVVCTVMDAALSCIESFMEAREQERQQLKKRKRKFESCMICAGILFAAFTVLSRTDNVTIQEAGISAVKIIAGEGMQRLVREDQDRPQIALTFDDGPDEKYTEKLLDGLKERGIKASFFLLGKSIEGNEHIVKRMHREGHLIGNHTYNHVQLDKISETRAREEILKTNNRIYEITGEYPVYMRPPYGAWKKDTEFCVEMIPVFWTIDTLDWKTQNVQDVLQRARKNIKNGSVILMHDEYETTVEAALALVDEFTEQGWEFVTVDRLILP